jgi:GDPmannose 4,6-dehydratase
VFARLSLDWRSHTVVSDTLFRPTDISEGRGNASKAERLLPWKARAHLPEVIDMMVQAELAGLRPPRA